MADGVSAMAAAVKDALTSNELSFLMENPLYWKKPADTGT
jgi:hypothetical protein